MPSVRALLVRIEAALVVRIEAALVVRIEAALVRRVTLAQQERDWLHAIVVAGLKDRISALEEDVARLQDRIAVLETDRPGSAREAAVDHRRRQRDRDVEDYVRLGGHVPKP